MCVKIRVYTYKNDRRIKPETYPESSIKVRGKKQVFLTVRPSLKACVFVTTDQRVV